MSAIVLVRLFWKKKTVFGRIVPVNNDKRKKYITQTRGKGYLSLHRVVLRNPKAGYSLHAVEPYLGNALDVVGNKDRIKRSRCQAANEVNEPSTSDG